MRSSIHIFAVALVLLLAIMVLGTAGDTVIVMGQNDNLAKLETALNP